MYQLNKIRHTSVDNNQIIELKVNGTDIARLSSRVLVRSSA